MNPVEWRRRPQGGKNLTSSPRLKPGDSNPSPGRASCFIGPRPPDALPGALAGMHPLGGTSADREGDGR